jgi:ribulose-5-phosphate 4-epimerase/fuculose-1-phosphate aldolase
MAHQLATPAAPAVRRPLALDRDAVWQARVDLAACFRAAAAMGLNEGICNHLSAMVPGSQDLFLVNPYGWGFDEVTASRLLVCDFHGNVVQGTGEPEATAFFIHARVHKQVPRARVAFHTHMPNATALAMLDGPPLSWSIQSSLKFYGRTLVDEHYNGLALSTGRPLKPVPAEIAQRTYAQMRQSDDESARLHLASVKRRLDRVAPEYRR